MGTDAGKSEESLHAERFAAAYRELSPRVLGYLRLHGVDDPESVTQDVFLALYPRLPAVNGGEDGVRTLTFSIAHARLVDHHRAVSRRPTLVVLDPESDPRRVPSAEETHGALTGEQNTLALLDQLRADQRDAVSLRVVAELSLAETAEVMGKSVGAVKQLQRRALEALRALMAEGATHD